MSIVQVDTIKSTFLNETRMDVKDKLGMWARQRLSASLQR